MTSLREILDVVLELERGTMALYARYARVFANEPRLKEFWFAMARDEAGHVGTLTLVATVLEDDRLLDRPSPSALDEAGLARLRSRLAQERQSPDPDVAQALSVALEIEESEIEDQVGELLKAVNQGDEYERYQRLLVHDLADLSYMIERYCEDDSALLARCDALVERHASALHRSSGH